MKVRFAILSAVAGVALAASVQAATFTAYNDCQSSTGGNAANTTLYGFGGAGATTSGQLKDFATGNTVAATVTVVNTSGVTSGSGPTAEFTTGTDAANMFGGKVINLGSVNYYGAAGWSFDLQFTNLTAGANYVLATTVDRGNTNPAPITGYPNRWTVISLVGADSSAYASSAGALAISSTATSIQSYNTEAGQLAKWTNIDPGADNAFTVHFTYAVNASEWGASGQDGVKAYGPAMFSLQESAVPEPTTLSLLGLAVLPLIRRRRA